MVVFIAVVCFFKREYPSSSFAGKCLFMSGLSNEQLNHMDDHTLPHKYGIGFTNMVERTTPGSKDLSRQDNTVEYHTC